MRPGDTGRQLGAVQGSVLPSPEFSLSSTLRRLLWAVAYKQIGVFALAEMIVFVFILVMGLAYAWRKGALEWI